MARAPAVGALPGFPRLATNPLPSYPLPWTFLFPWLESLSHSLTARALQSASTLQVQALAKCEHYSQGASTHTHTLQWRALPGASTLKVRALSQCVHSPYVRSQDVHSQRGSTLNVGALTKGAYSRRACSHSACTHTACALFRCQHSHSASTFTGRALAQCAHSPGASTGLVRALSRCEHSHGAVLHGRTVSKRELLTVRALLECGHLPLCTVAVPALSMRMLSCWACTLVARLLLPGGH